MHRANAVWQKTPRFLKVIIIIIIALIIAAIIAKIIAIAKRPPNAKYIQGGGEVRNNFNPDKYAEVMYNAIGGWLTLANTKAEAAQQLFDLSDNELIAVYNKWNELYSTKTSYGQPYGTLTNSMKAEWNVPDISFGGTNYWFELQNRLDRLNLK